MARIGKIVAGVDEGIMTLALGFLFPAAMVAGFAIAFLGCVYFGHMEG